MVNFKELLEKEKEKKNMKQKQTDLDDIFSDDNKVKDEDVPRKEYWYPKQEGDKLNGVVLELFQGQYGLQAVIGLKDGSQTTTPAHTILSSKLQLADLGDKIGVEFKGSVPSDKGNDLMIYDVFLKSGK